MRRSVLIFISILFFNITFSQEKKAILCTFDNIKPEFFNYNCFVFGEMHYQSNETSSHQLRLIDKLVENGVSTIIIYLEVSPSNMFFLYNYFASLDSTWLSVNPGLKDNFSMLIQGLHDRKDKVHFSFVSIDLETRQGLKTVNKFTKDLFFNIPDSLGFAHLDRLRSTRNQKEIVRLATEFMNDTVLQKKYSAVLSHEFFPLFHQEMKVLSEEGFIRWFGITKKGIALRERNMAQVIDNLIKQDSVKHIITVGRNHITPKSGQVIANLFKYMVLHKRADFITIPIVYSDSFYLLYNGTSYPNNEDFGSLIRNKIFDLILIPCERIY